MQFNIYRLWFFVFFTFSIIFYLIGLYLLSFDYLVLLDWNILTLNSCSIVMTLLFDWMSLLFVSGVMFISSMVIFYSSSYMSGDVNKIRFLLLVVMFVMSMCFMILSPNLISILLGWDGLGLVSYCLVIYFQNYKSYNAGMLTVLTNRIGDVFILLSIGIFFNNGSWYFMYYSIFNSNWVIYFVFMLILASFTKSAQIPFSSWLPAAMAAPTPVSALVHSSTLVTAGVYLMIRFSNFLELYNVTFFLLLSSLTMFMSGLGACYEFDMKKIIALSTLKQLGLMMSILFMGYPVISFFHLLSHAFFKALLFLCAGLIIHCMNDVQDIRFMGGLNYNIPYTVACFGVANFSLCGLPFLSGFYSKDMIMEFMSLNYYNMFIYLIFYLSLGLTAVYSMRLIYYCLISHLGLSSFNSYSEDFYMMFSMFFLMIMGVVKGSVLSWFLFPFPDLVCLPYLMKLLAIFLVIMGGWLGYEMSIFSFFELNYNYELLLFLGTMWFMPFFSTYYLSSGILMTSMNYIKVLDYSWGEYLVSRLLSYYMLFLNKFIMFYQNNNFKLYFIMFLIFTLFFFL
uniref:NADH-ubiquinone oxidoreductase chain 5 n=1 Tax=Geocoris pallidipennis TaxID=300797 RepID=B7SMC1_GEOPA|nr:NADH dehydrogenase subunit 5 [Geocoris pallidipennis]ABZ02015.1 NADH dehydrogenase subunit 5 [Geocoris pallidipennis]